MHALVRRAAVVLALRPDRNAVRGGDGGELDPTGGGVAVRCGHRVAAAPLQRRRPVTGRLAGGNGFSAVIPRAHRIECNGSGDKSYDRQHRPISRKCVALSGRWFHAVPPRARSAKVRLRRRSRPAGAECSLRPRPHAARLHRLDSLPDASHCVGNLRGDRWNRDARTAAKRLFAQRPDRYR
ncbi:MAG: hypothetical protein AVDCRST_MAG50-3377 [uncultured Acidimicrobiales bacterium]|uniref:Uncharacterized protein n=1 Tax=uncultured Acidimicrobiales bacterium TaxID=310071 RepID=A0A6J4J4F5_9ACTN|nr:MAG: hypothetical protein AVDCRST_MAG50-3377 [uncultured Acidimicrobiales bacterium]